MTALPRKLTRLQLTALPQGLYQQVQQTLAIKMGENVIANSCGKTSYVVREQSMIDLNFANRTIRTQLPL